jgi:SSS family solute:Na+ symporter
MTSRAAEVVLYGGGFVCLLVGICNVLNFPYAGFWPHFLMLSVYLFLGLAAVAVLVSLGTKSSLTPNGLQTLLEVNRSNGQNLRPVWMGWAILAVLMLSIYWIFS